MKTINEIEIKASVKAAYQVAAEVLEWPRLLPHYRWVTLLGQDGNKNFVEMAAHRDGKRARSKPVMAAAQKPKASRITWKIQFCSIVPRTRWAFGPRA